VETKEQLANLKKDLDSYFKKLSQIFEKNFSTCLLLKHLFLNSILEFDFNLETKNKFHNLVSKFLAELEEKKSNYSLLSSVVASCLLREIDEKYFSLLAGALKKKIKEITDLVKKEELNDFFSFLNLQDFADFQECCLDARFLNKINEFIDQEFFSLGDLHLFFSKCNKKTQENILYFLKSSFQQNCPLDYDDYIKVTERAVYFNWLSEVEETEKDKL